MTLILINNSLAKQKGNLDPVLVYKNGQELMELSIIAVHIREWSLFCDLVQCYRDLSSARFACRYATRTCFDYNSPPASSPETTRKSKNPTE